MEIEPRWVRVARALLVASGMAGALALSLSGRALRLSDHRMPGITMNPIEVWTINWGLFALVVISFLTLGVVLRRWPRLADMPNRFYWLAEERRAATISEVTGWLYVLGMIFNAWIVAVTVILGLLDFDFMWNRSAAVRDMGMTIFGTLFVPGIAWLLLYIRRFWRVEEGEG